MDTVDSEKSTENDGNATEEVANSEVTLFGVARDDPTETVPRQPVDIVASEDAQVSFRASPIKKGTEKMAKEDKGNEEFPVPCKTFLDSLVDTDDHVWAHWLNRNHGRENHKPKEWATLLEAHKNGTHSSLNS